MSSDDAKRPDSSQEGDSAAKTPGIEPEGAPEEIRRNFQIVAKGLGLAGSDDPVKPPINLDESMQVLSREMGLLARTSNLFRQGSSFFTVDPRNGETRPMDAPRFCSWIEEIAWPFKWSKTDRKFCRLGKDLSALILAADGFREHVRELRGVRIVRLPVWRGEGSSRSIELLPNGFDEPTGIFTIDALPYNLDCAANPHTWPPCCRLFAAFCSPKELNAR